MLPLIFPELTQALHLPLGAGTYGSSQRVTTKDIGSSLHFAPVRFLLASALSGAVWVGTPMPPTYNKIVLFSAFIFLAGFGAFRKKKYQLRADFFRVDVP